MLPFGGLVRSSVPEPEHGGCGDGPQSPISRWSMSNVRVGPGGPARRAIGERSCRSPKRSVVANHTRADSNPTALLIGEALGGHRERSAVADHPDAGDVPVIVGRVVISWSFASNR